MNVLIKVIIGTIRYTLLSLLRKIPGWHSVFTIHAILRQVQEGITSFVNNKWRSVLVKIVYEKKDNTIQIKEFFLNNTHPYRPKQSIWLIIWYTLIFYNAGQSGIKMFTQVHLILLSTIMHVVKSNVYHVGRTNTT